MVPLRPLLENRFFFLSLSLSLSASGLQSQACFDPSASGIG